MTNEEQETTQPPERVLLWHPNGDYWWSPQGVGSWGTTDFRQATRFAPEETVNWLEAGWRIATLDGGIDHDGGECPVHRDLFVVVDYDGTADLNELEPKEAWRWAWVGAARFRLAPPTDGPKPKCSAGVQRERLGWYHPCALPAGHDGPHAADDRASEDVCECEPPSGPNRYPGWPVADGCPLHGTPALTERERIAREVIAERERQDGKWGGAENDDRNTREDWHSFLCDYAGWARMMWRMGSLQKARRRLIQVAAIALAAVESIDRQNKALDGRAVNDVPR